MTMILPVIIILHNMADFSSCYGDSTIRITQHNINILEVGMVHYASQVSIATIQNTQKVYYYSMSLHSTISYTHYNYTLCHYNVTNTDVEH